MPLFNGPEQPSLARPSLCRHTGLNVHVQPPHEIGLSLPLCVLLLQPVPPLAFSEFRQCQPLEFRSLFFHDLYRLDRDFFQFLYFVIIHFYIE